MTLDNCHQAFFAILRAGLWERDVSLPELENTDYSDVYHVAEEQSVVGLVAAGIEHVIDAKVPQEQVLQFVGQTLQLEQRNLATNKFLAGLVEKLREEEIYPVLVKGQGIAQCYKRPLWRASGDVDLLLSEDNYRKAKDILIPLALNVEQEYSTFKHLGMIMNGGFEVELHGALYTRLSKRIDKGIDAIQEDVLCFGNVRSWQNGGTKIFLPGIDDDVVFVFTHILHHFFVEGIGLRQICDWCRLLWTYQDTLDRKTLSFRLDTMGIMSEWRVFAAVAVDWLGMPVETMPLYSNEKKWSRKAEKIIEYVLECGNFGHKRQRMKTKSFVGGKVISVWRKMRDFGRHTRVFPMDSVRFFFHFLRDGVKLASSQPFHIQPGRTVDYSFLEKSKETDGC